MICDKKMYNILSYIIIFLRITYTRIRETRLYNNIAFRGCVNDKNIHHKQEETGELPEPKNPHLRNLVGK